MRTLKVYPMFWYIRKGLHNVKLHLVLDFTLRGLVCFGLGSKPTAQTTPSKGFPKYFSKRGNTDASR